MSLATLIDPLKEPRLTNFSEEDRAFLAEFFERYPGIAKQFSHYVKMPVMMRMDEARKDIFRLPRAGWVRHGIPNPETVYEHSETLVGLIERYCPEDVSEADFQRMKDMARYHDFPEAIATDFTPHDPISTEDKQRIERLAARVLFEAPQHARLLGIVNDYIDQETEHSHLVHDFDKMHAVVKAHRYECQYPEEQKGLAQEFLNHAETRLKTDTGNAFLQEFCNHREAVIEALNCPPPSVPMRS